MTEGLVMEVHKNYVIVLTHCGEFLKLRKKGTVNIGDIYKGNIYRTFSPYYAAAAAALFIITTFSGYTAYAHQIVGIVDISGSKSIKLFVNRSGKIQKVEGINNSSDLKNSTVDNALKEINNLAIKEGIFEKGEKITIQTKELKPSKVNLNEMKHKIQSVINNKDIKQDSKNGAKDVPKNNKNTKPEKNNQNNNGKGQSSKESKKQDIKVKPLNQPESPGNAKNSINNKNMSEKRNNKEKENKDKENKKIKNKDKSTKGNSNKD